MPRFAGLPILMLSIGLTVTLSAPALAGGRGSGTGSHFFGLLHQPLGSAGLAVDPAGRLIVTNIGSSGQDGVSITLSQTSPPGNVAPGWAGVLDFGPSGGLATGMHLEIQSRDQFGNAVCGMTISETNGGQTAIGVSATNFPPSSITVEIRLDDQIVQSMELLPPFPPVLATGAIGNNGGNGVEVRSTRKKEFINQFDVDICEDIVRLVSPVPISLGNGMPPIDGDELRVSLNGLPPGTRYIGNLAVVGSNVPSVLIADECLMRATTGKSGSTKPRHAYARAVQSAHIIGVGDIDGDGLADIACDNIGSSGQDGISLSRQMIPVTQPDVSGEMFAMDCDWHAPPVGSLIKFMIKLRAMAGAAPEAHALSISSIGGGMASLAIEPCAGCGPYGVVVEAIHRGVVVDSVAHDSPPQSLAMCAISGGGGGGAGGGAGSLSAYRQQIFNDSGSQGGTIAQCLVMECRPPVAGPCTLTGSTLGTVTADRVRVRCVPFDGTMESIEDISLLGSDLPVVHLTYMRSRVNQLEGTLQALGLLARSTGDAIVTPTPDGSLFVRDCDDDGVELEVGDYPGATVTVELGGGGGGGGSGGALYVEYTAKQGKTGKAKFYDDETDGAGGAKLLDYENASCPTCPVLVELLSSGSVVASHTITPPFTEPVASVDRNYMKIPWRSAGGSMQLSFEADTSITLSNGATASASCIRLTPQGMPTGPLADLVSTIEISASLGSSFTVTNAGMMETGSLGFVTKKNNGQLAGKKRTASPGFSGPQCALIVSNLGSSGQDGAMFVGEDDDCDGESDLSDEIDVAMGATVIPASSSMAINQKGLCCPNLLGSSDFESRCTIVGAGATNDILVDFTECGAPSYRVQVSNAGAAQGVMTGATAPLAARAFTSVHKIVGFTCSRVAVGPSLVWSPRTNIRFSGPVDIQLSNGSVLVGDALTITAENPTSPFAGMESVSITGANLPDDRLVILDYAITPTPISDCPADINGDNTVNVADLLSVISSWGACPPAPANCPADTNGDHNVNVADLLAVISAWGACQ